MAIVNELSIKAKHFDEVLRLSESLKNKIRAEDEKALREIEKAAKSDNVALLQETAKQLGSELITNQQLVEMLTPRTACFVRYIVVPLLYTLGFSQAAADLNQQSFNYLFPKLNMAIQNKLNGLFSQRLEDTYQKIQEVFIPPENSCWRYYFRLKSNQAIWKKISSIADFEKIDLNSFCQQVEDFIALRWTIKPGQEENRYDAVLNGVRALPKQDLYKLRNQQRVQETGFSSEPVIKALYVIDKVPVEVQILGGDIECYMSAKGYAAYKTGLQLHDEMNEDDNAARLGVCIFYQENNRQNEFYQMMLDELCGRKVVYNSERAYTPELTPLRQVNQEYMIAGYSEPLYLLSNVLLQEEINERNRFSP